MSPLRRRSNRPPIETERLVIRLPQSADVPGIAAYYRTNREHLQPWSPTWPREVFTESFWRDQVVQRQADVVAGLAAGMFMFLRRGGELVGNISLTQIVRGNAQHAQLGYGLAAAAQGNGYMVEAVTAVVDYAFVDLALHRVAATYVPHNRRSAAVLRRAGFTVEGYARDYLLLDGRWEDHILTAIVNPRDEA
jgi:[ribosomal protein S5]-alanine N-acetyltransferase